MFLGIEIGGTKLQLGVGDGESATFRAFRRADIDAQRGAAGILEQIRQLGGELVQSHAITRVGFGFGGPVDTSQGRVIKSHQIRGWENFHLGSWCHEHLGVPAIVRISLRENPRFAATAAACACWRRIVKCRP